MARRTMMTPRDVGQRAAHASAFLAAAELVDVYGDAADVSPRSNVVASLAVLAGIAASDALCGHLLGFRSGGDDHGEAVRLLASSHPRCSPYASHLRRLIASKTNAHYEPEIISDMRARELLTSAQRLLSGLELELDRPARA